MIQDSNWRPLPDFLTIKKSTIEGLGYLLPRHSLPEQILELPTFMIPVFKMDILDFLLELL